jgi:hypothetical protein
MANKNVWKMCENSYQFYTLFSSIIHTFYTLPSENGDEKGFTFFTIIFSPKLA